MANYETKGLTNYFKVKDKEKFENDVISSMYEGGAEIIFVGDKVGILFEDWQGFNSWYLPYYDEESEDIDYDKEVSIPQLVSKHLVEGEERKIIMHNIYDLAKELTDTPENITEASY